MQIGVGLPRGAMMLDPGAMRAFARGVEAAGFDFITSGERIIDKDRMGAREPFALHAFLAACTERVQLIPSIVLLPQRPTVLTAKQAAEVDVLSGGRFILGVGVGSHPEEYAAVGQHYASRGRRIEEQIALLRALWTNETVTFKGEWHQLDDMGIAPLPVQRPIPIWMGGGGTEAALRRIARLADGWLPSSSGEGDTATLVERFRGYVREAGRDPGDVSILGRIQVDAASPENGRAAYDRWVSLGASHVGLSVRGGAAVDEQLRVLEAFRTALS